MSDDAVYHWDHATSGWVRDFRVPPGIARLLLERVKVKPAEHLRECVGLPRPVEAEVMRMKQQFAADGDDDAADALLELQWLDHPCSRARRDAKIAQAQRAERERAAALFDLQVEAATLHGFVFREGRWVHISEVRDPLSFPGGIRNRFSR